MPAKPTKSDKSARTTKTNSIANTSTTATPAGGTTTKVSLADTKNGVQDTNSVADRPPGEVSRVVSSKIDKKVSISANPTKSELDLNDIKSHVSGASGVFGEIVIPASKVSVIEAVAVSTIFQDFEEQSELFEKLFPGDKKSRTQSELLSYDDRFKKEVTEKEMERLPVIKSMPNPFHFSEKDLGTPEELEALKLQKDRRLLSKIVRQAKREIDDYQTFRTLNDNIDRLQEWKRAAISLISRYQESKSNLLDLCTQMVNYAGEMSSAELDRKEIINFLKDKLHLTTQKGKQDQRYARAFHEARNDYNLNQMSYELHLAESHMKFLETEMMRDKFCHRNVEDYFELICWDTQKKIDHWNTKFDLDLETIDRKVREKQDSIRAQQNQIELLNKMIDERMVDLGPWEDQKRREKELRCENLRLFYSARKIQRWWRQYMVKHKLYKKKKGKKGKAGQANEPVEEVQSEQQSAKSRTLSATPVSN